MKAILVKYHGPTNTKGSRLSASAEGVGRIYTHVDHSKNIDECKADVAQKLCDKYKWCGHLAGGTLPNGDDVFVFVG